MTKTVNIFGVEIEVTAFFDGGAAFVATNNYGEPKNEIRHYQTKQAAFDAEVEELKQMIGYSRCQR